MKLRGGIDIATVFISGSRTLACPGNNPKTCNPIFLHLPASNGKEITQFSFNQLSETFSSESENKKYASTEVTREDRESQRIDGEPAQLVRHPLDWWSLNFTRTPLIFISLFLHTFHPEIITSHDRRFATFFSRRGLEEEKRTQHLNQIEAFINNIFECDPVCRHNVVPTFNLFSSRPTSILMRVLFSWISFSPLFRGGREARLLPPWRVKYIWKCENSPRVCQRTFSLYSFPGNCPGITVLTDDRLRRPIWHEVKHYHRSLLTRGVINWKGSHHS